MIKEGTKVVPNENSELFYNITVPKYVKLMHVIRAYDDHILVEVDEVTDAGRELGIPVGNKCQYEIYLECVDTVGEEENDD